VTDQPLPCRWCPVWGQVDRGLPGSFWIARSSADGPTVAELRELLTSATSSPRPWRRLSVRLTLHPRSRCFQKHNTGRCTWVSGLSFAAGPGCRPAATSTTAGDWLDADANAVGIVGSRVARVTGLEGGREQLARGLVSRGGSRSSRDSPRGIDRQPTAARWRAVGRTIAAMAGGLSKIYRRNTPGWPMRSPRRGLFVTESVDENGPSAGDVSRPGTGS